MSTNRMSRRAMIAGAAAGAGTLAIAGCADRGVYRPGINVVRVREVPVDDPDDSAWSDSPELGVELGPQSIALPQNLAPAVTEVKVRAIHDGTRIGFRLQWDDPDVDDLTVPVDGFRDAVAVLIAPGIADETLRTMGSATVPVTLLHWKADWQRDVDAGRQDIGAVYPNLSVDAYPPLWDVAPSDVDVASYEAAGATEWLPGVHVVNPTSLARRTSPVEKAIAYGFGTTTTAPTQNASGRGERTDNGWRVVIVKPLAAVDDGETAIMPDTTSTCAFAVWSGQAHDAGSRKAPSTTVHPLSMAP